MVAASLEDGSYLGLEDVFYGSHASRQFPVQCQKLGLNGREVPDRILPGLIQVLAQEKALLLVIVSARTHSVSVLLHFGSEGLDNHILPSPGVLEQPNVFSRHGPGQPFHPALESLRDLFEFDRNHIGFFRRCVLRGHGGGVLGRAAFGDGFSPARGHFNMLFDVVSEEGVKT